MFYREAGEDEGRVGLWLEHSKSARVVSWFPAYVVILYNIFIVYYYNKSKQVVWWLVSWHATIGTWVRFPGPPHICFIFFHTGSHAGCSRHSTICLNHPRRHVSSYSNPKATRCWTPCSWSTLRLGNFQESNGLANSWARIARTNLHIWAFTPSGFFLFLHMFLIILFSIIII